MLELVGVGLNHLRSCLCREFGNCRLDGRGPLSRIPSVNFDFARRPVVQRIGLY